VLDLLWKHHLYLKPEKCDFEETKVKYLGMIIGENTVRWTQLRSKQLQNGQSLPAKEMYRHF